ncbi:MAG: hypothetical protein NC078_02370 [Ruminococcus sp.]|nr:hypothetical protein [Ruminococcus sp.]
MFDFKKIIPGAAAIALSLIVFTGCKREEDKSKYDYLKTDIVGAWCDETGPEVVETEGGTARRIYEFTSSGKVYYYFCYEDMGAVYIDGDYTIDGNIFDSDGSKCRINVENDILTMTYDGGSSRYRRMDAAELLEYSVYAQEPDLYAQQEPLIMESQQAAAGMLTTAGQTGEETVAAVTEADVSEEQSETAGE